MKVLRAKLYEREVEERSAKASEIAAEKKELGWGSQFRSYVLHPYKMVKDSRTGVEIGQPGRGAGWGPGGFRGGIPDGGAPPDERRGIATGRPQKKPLTGDDRGTAFF